VFQQPEIDPGIAVPVLSEGMDVPVDPGAELVMLELPVVRLDVPIVEPAQGDKVLPGVAMLSDGLTLIVLSGPGTPIRGLTPALPISVAPSGIAPPLRVDAVLAGLESGDANPPEAPVPAVEAQAVAPVIPPPSKLELVLVVGEPEDAPVTPQMVLFVMVPIGTGLRPPGSISVAPSGMPAVDPVAVEPGIPSGDVCGIADGLVMVCARPVPQVASSTTAITIERRIDVSRPGSTTAYRRSCRSRPNGRRSSSGTCARGST
jgi:hypothetical protein